MESVASTPELNALQLDEVQSSQQPLTHPQPPSVLLLDERGHHSQKVAVCFGQIKGLKLHVLSDRCWVPVRFSRHVASFRNYPSGASDAHKLRAVLQAIKQTGSKVLVPVTEGGSRFIQTHWKALAPHIAVPPCPTLETLDVVTNKDSFCAFLEKNSLPLPATLYLDSAKPAESELRNLKFPILFKPAHSSGGIGIQSFSDPESFLSFSTMNRIEPRSILQSYVQGHDVDCSVLCRNGMVLAHTIQKSFLPRRNKYGSDEAIEFVDDPGVLEVVERLIDALNWSGIAHLDLRYDEQDGQVKVLDFNARYWTSLLGSLAAGVNFPYLSCLAALGVDLSHPVAGTGKFFTAETAARNLLQRCVGRGGVKILPNESGLAYALRDPGPRVFTALKRAVSFVKPK